MSEPSDDNRRDVCEGCGSTWERCDDSRHHGFIKCCPDCSHGSARATSPATPLAAVPTEEERKEARALLNANYHAFSASVSGTELHSRGTEVMAQALATARTSARSAALEEALSTLRGFLALVEPEAAPGDERAQVMGIRRAIEVLEALTEAKGGK